MKISWLIGLVILVLAIPSLSSASANEPIVLGVVQSLTGPGSSMGIPGKAGYEFAAEEINKAGGFLGHPVKVVVYDDKTNAEQGLRMAKRLVVEDKVSWLLGGGNSQIAVAISGYAKAEKIPYIIAQPASAAVTEENGHRYVFRIGDNTVQQSRLVAILVNQKWPEAKNVFQMEQNYEYGHFRAQEFAKEWKKLHPDGKITNVWIPLGTYDFTPYITQLMSLGSSVDVVVDGMWGADGLALIKQAVAFDAFKKFKWFSGGGGIDTMGRIKRGDPAPIGALAASSYPFFSLNNSINNKLWPEIKKRCAMWPSNGAVYSYTAVHALKKAYEKARTTDVEKVIDAMEGLKIETPLGIQLEIRKVDHQTLWPSYAGTVQWDDKWEFPVMTNLIMIDPKKAYHTEKEVLEIREKAKNK
jgi:branched-chain amino acid transport system substrate-binding protein